MTDLIAFELLTPEKRLRQLDVTMAIIPGVDGYAGIMAGHAAYIMALQAGVVELQTDGKAEKFFIDGGYAEILGTRCTVMTEEAIELSLLSRAEIEKELEEATYRLEHVIDAQDQKTSERRLANAEAKLRILDEIKLAA